jgi:hypothetical protein
MICMLLTRRMIRVCQYWTYGHDQEGRSWLGVDQWGRQSSKGVDCDIPAQGFNRIDRILIPPRYTFFSRSPTTKNFWVKRVWPSAILRWVIDREVFLGAHK